MSRNGWKGRNYWKIWLLQLLWRLNFTCSTKPSKTLKNQDCHLLKHSLLHKNFPDYWECFPDDAKAGTTQLSLVDTQYAHCPPPKCLYTLLYFILYNSDTGGAIAWSELRVWWKPRAPELLSLLQSHFTLQSPERCNLCTLRTTPEPLVSSRDFHLWGVVFVLYFSQIHKKLGPTIKNRVIFCLH